MCQCAMTRRGFLGATAAAGAGTALLLGGCGAAREVDPVSEDSIEAMGRRAWQDIKSTTPVARDTEAQAALDRVSRRLLTAAGEAPGEWEILVFDRPDINAFALPGKKIGVFQGMSRIAANDDQLAAVVGHEIGHLQADHARERIDTQMAKEVWLRAASLLLQMGEVENARQIATALGVGMDYGVILPYSRRQELEADRLGLRLMAEAGFQPEAAIAFWQRMAAAGGARPPAFLSTHPAPETRIREIREAVQSRA